MEKNPALADLIRRATEARGWGPSELARAVGVAESGDPTRVNRANARRWLTGERTPTYWWPYVAQVLSLNPTAIPPSTQPPSPSMARDVVSSAVDSTLTALAPTVGPAELPREIRSSDIDEVQQAALTLTSWHNLHGGAGLVHQSSTAQLSWAARLLDVPCTSSLHPQLFSAVAHLGMVTGAVCFDAFAHQDARRAFAFAAACAEEGGEWHLRSKIYSWRARHAVWMRQSSEALTHTLVGAVHSDRLTSTERAMLSTAAARAHAQTGDVQATLKAVGEADDAYSHAQPADDPPWMAYYDHAQHQGDTGHALFELAMITRNRKHVNAARDRLAQATGSHADSYIRSRVFSRTKLATLTMAAGDPYEAADIGATALEEAARIRSGRADAGLAELAVTTRREHATVAAATALSDRITRTIGRGSTP